MGRQRPWELFATGQYFDSTDEAADAAVTRGLKTDFWFALKLVLMIKSGTLYLFRFSLSLSLAK